jgi:glycosyltransferase 2 family protein
MTFNEKESRFRTSSTRSKKIFNLKNFLLILFIVLGIVAVVLIYKTVKISEVLKTLSNTTPLLLLYYIIIQFIMIVVLTWRWQVILKSQGVKHIGFWKLNNYRLVGQGVSFLTPSGKLGGEPIRAGLTSSRENITFEKSLSSVLIDRTIDISSALAFFSLGAIILLLSFVIPAVLATILVIVCMVALFLIITFNYRMLKGKAFFHYLFRFLGLSRIKKLKKFEEKLIDVESLVIKFYHEDRKYFYQAIGISALSWVLMFVEYKIAALMVGQSLTPLQIFLVFSFIGIAYIVPVPMGIGSLEASQVTAFSIMSISSAAGLALSFLVRIKDLFIAIIGVALLGMYGFNVKKAVDDTKYLDTEVENLKKLEKDETQRRPKPAIAGNRKPQEKDKT